MNLKRRKHYFGDMLSEEQLTNTEKIEQSEVEREIEIEIETPADYSCREACDYDNWGLVTFL